MALQKFNQKGSVLLGVVCLSVMVSALLVASCLLVSQDLDSALLFRRRLVACEHAANAFTEIQNQTLTLPFAYTFKQGVVRGYQDDLGIHISATYQQVSARFINHHEQWQEVDSTEGEQE